VNKAVLRMLEKYECNTVDEYIQALREIMQEMALLGLYRGKFFEHAAFYGGTALRIIYGLERFSEDLDFSLLKPDSGFTLDKYSGYLEKELAAYGFTVSVELKNKAVESQVQSAFLKADTANELLVIEAGESLISQISHGQKIKIKIEVDTDPPADFDTEVKYLLNPIPFSVRMYTLPCLFAGKMHALLFRRWGNRVKGRDWYDLVWYLSNYPEISLQHLKARMVQTGDWESDKPFFMDDLKSLYIDAVDKTDIEQARKDVIPFLKDPTETDIWSKNFFKSLSDKFVD